MDNFIDTTNEKLDCMTVDAEAEEIIEIAPETETETTKDDIEVNNPTDGNDTAEQGTVSSSEQSESTLIVLPKKSAIKKLDPTRAISANFENELKWIDSLIQKIGEEKKGLEALPKKYNGRLNKIFQRFIFVNKHNKKDICIFALRYGKLLNEIEERFTNKTDFTKWRSEAFPDVSERYIQKWQQAAKVGLVVEHFAEFGLGVVIELKYLVETWKDEFKQVEEPEIISVIQSFINLGGHSTERNHFRFSMDAAVTHFRLINKVKEKTVLEMENLIVEIKPLILELVKITGGALEEPDVQKIVDKFKILASENERVQFLEKYTMDKASLATGEPKENNEDLRKNLRGTNEAIVRFNRRFKLKNTSELDLTKDQAIEAYKNLMKYFTAKNIDINAIIKEA